MDSIVVSFFQVLKSRNLHVSGKLRIKTLTKILIQNSNIHIFINTDTMSHNTDIVGGIYIRTSIWKEIEGLQGLRFQSGHAWLVLLQPWMKRNGWIATLLIYWVYGTFIRNPVIWSLDIKFSPVDSNQIQYQVIKVRNWIPMWSNVA